MSTPEALESCRVPMQLPTFLFDNPALEHTKIQTETSMSRRSRKEVARKNRPSSIFTRQPPTGRSSLQRRKQQSVANLALHHSVYNSSAVDLQTTSFFTEKDFIIFSYYSQ
ncbi:hypothetical protein AVEN_163320-1 [Araneus ventricosus]|uniref:Uncharacterized protein n=1 Tax=Araneus ventricosus TaxID=182803 RepID=A0A4Y2VE74_ARAVE|nr:hypothetical protein AVEN_163320-1 [Araneus ventricosus]